MFLLVTIASAVPMILRRDIPETPEDGNFNDTTQAISEYKQLQASRIKRNRYSLIELGLLDVDNKQQQQGDHGFLAAYMATALLNNWTLLQK